MHYVVGLELNDAELRKQKNPADITCAKNFKSSGRIYNTTKQLGFHDLPNSAALIGCYYNIDGLW